MLSCSLSSFRLVYMHHTKFSSQSTVTPNCECTTRLRCFLQPLALFDRVENRMGSSSGYMHFLCRCPILPCAEAAVPNSKLRRCHSALSAAAITSVSNQTRRVLSNSLTAVSFYLLSAGQRWDCLRGMCFLFRPRDKRESVITWRAISPRRFHSKSDASPFGMATSKDEGGTEGNEGGEERGGKSDTNQICGFCEVQKKKPGWK